MIHCSKITLASTREGWPRWLVDVGIWLNRPFGVRREYADLQPWQSVREHLREVEHREMLFGAAYLSVGEAGPRNRHSVTAPTAAGGA